MHICAGRAAILLAMRRHVIEISKEVRAKKEAAKAAAEGKKDFIDQVRERHIHIEARKGGIYIEGKKDFIDQVRERRRLDWTGLDWTGLDWTGLDWTGLDLS